MRVLLAVLLVGIAGCGEGSSPPSGGTVPTTEGSQSKADKPPAQAADADAVTALKKLGAEIERNEQGEVVTVFLYGTKITDAGLVHLKGLTKPETLNLINTEITDAGLMHLKGLTTLQELNLGGTKITDAGLVHLKGLTKLQTLHLGYEVTDAGLVHLKELTELRELRLYGTKITDAGLVHLTGMTKLERLILGMTKITDAGVAELRKALPNCKISK